MEKLENTQLKTFLEKYTKNAIPTPSNIRNNYISSSLEKKLGNLRLAVGNHPFSVYIDETTDVCRRYVTNIVLKDMVTGKTHLAHTEYLDATNFSSITMCLMNGLQFLYPNGIQSSNALILITDGASYMKKVTKTYCNPCPRR